MSYDTILENYSRWSHEWTDMVEHMPTLQKYASQSRRVVELGVHDCTSTWGLLAGKPEWMRSYDIIRQPQVTDVENAVVDSGIDFKFILASSIKVEIEQTDLLFIDTFHGYEQLNKELTMHNKKVNKYIIMHDTTVFETKDQDGNGIGLWPAIEQFLQKNSNWQIKERFTNCYGLTILERLSA